MLTKIMTNRAKRDGTANNNGRVTVDARATNPEAAPVAGGAHRVADLIARRRDAHGNRQPWFYSHSVPTIEDVPLSRTPLARALSAVADVLPVSAAELEHFYEHKLRPALRRLIAVRDAEELRLAQYNETAQRRSDGLDRDIEAAIASDTAALVSAEGRLAEAHREAARQVALTGGVYDPQNPADECVLRTPMPDQAALAAELALPWTPSDRSALIPWLVGWLVTLVVGMMIGLSLGIVAGFIPLNGWTNRPVQLAFMLMVGTTAAIAGKWAIKLSAREASQRYWLGRPASNWAFLAVASVLVAGLVVSIDSFVEREGLMASVRLQDLARSLSGQAKPGDGASREWLYLLMAIILTFGYAVNAFWEGYLSGRYDACLNRVRQVQIERHGAADQAWRQNDAVMSALEALGNVRNAVAEQRLLVERIGERTSAIESKRQPLVEALPADALLRIQDAVDQLNGTQATFNAMLAEAKAKCGEGTALLDRLPHRWRSVGRRRQTQRDSTRRIV